MDEIGDFSPSETGGFIGVQVRLQPQFVSLGRVRDVFRGSLISDERPFLSQNEWLLTREL